MKPEKIKLGKLEMQLLAYAQMRETDLLISGQVASALGITPEQEWKLLNRMATSGLIIRLKWGVYLVPSRIPSGGRWTLSGYRLFSRLMAVLKGKYQSLIPWIPSEPAKGSINRKWGLIVNGAIPRT